MLALFALVAGCAEDDLTGSLSQGECGPAGQCAAGYACNAGNQCVPVSDGGAGSGGSAGSDAGGPDVESDAPCASCTTGQICCDDVCTDKNVDPEHCGACAKACPGTVCQAGTCTNECLPGLADCNKNVLDGCEAPLASCAKDAAAD